MTPAALLALTQLEAPAENRAPDIVVPAVHSLALMTVMRATASYLWPDPFSKPQYFAAHYEEAFTMPPKFDRSQPFMQWDGDNLLINVVGHGLFGSELYLRARQCRFGVVGSFAFAAATSALWEYGFEANGVRPSAQDLVFTPLAGIALGEARYFVHRATKDVRHVEWVRWVVDPFGEIERAAGTGC
ncbi:MAG: DUF3943 domain-containing protein [Labilithrix sp.]|nr:DUF3943 domain-containing protein [Labilithrix sp.]MCW5816878.1 DUF3943 domain-containing protein [Labilithrix sp.]